MKKPVIIFSVFVAVIFCIGIYSKAIVGGSNLIKDGAKRLTKLTKIIDYKEGRYEKGFIVYRHFITLF